MLIHVALFIIGTVFGSFASMASYRLPESKTLAGRSYCPKCNHKLGIIDLVPLFSFLWSKGKCRYCKTHVSWRYPMIECLTGIMFVINGIVFYPNVVLLVITCTASVGLVVIIFSDLEHYIIPDQAVAALGLVGVFFAYCSSYELIQVLLMPLAMMAIALLLKYSSRIFFGREALGMGDVKFFTISGLYLAAETLSSFFLIAGVLAFLFGLWWRILGKGEYFPFGPALCVSLYTCVTFPQHVSNFLVLNSAG